jgi:hypothetical protein
VRRKQQQQSTNTAASAPVANTPAPAQSAEPARPNDEPTSSPELADDAMKAMAQAAGFWMLGVADDGGAPTRQWHRHAASGTCLPKDAPGWELVNEKTYGPGDESVSLWNEKLGAKVTLFTYPAQAALEPAFDSVLEQMAKTCTEGPVMSTKMSPGKIGGCIQRLKEGPLLLEQALLFKNGPWLHKARITYPAGSDAYSAVMSVVARAFKPCAAQA